MLTLRRVRGTMATMFHWFSETYSRALVRLDRYDPAVTLCLWILFLALAAKAGLLAAEVALAVLLGVAVYVAIGLVENL